MCASIGNDSPRSTTPKTSQSGRCSRTPSWYHIPGGRGSSINDHYRRPTPPSISRKPSQRAHHGSQYGWGHSNFDHDSQDLIRMQWDLSFQECVEKYIY